MLAMKVKVAEFVISGTVHLTRAGPDLRGASSSSHYHLIIIIISPERV